MDKLFFSKDNFNLLSLITSKKIKEQYDVNINSRFNKDLLNSMKYVYSNVNPNPPPHISKEKYLELMNTKCLSIIIPKVENIVSSERDIRKSSFVPPQKSMQNVRESNVQSQFDNQFGSQFDNQFPANIVPQHVEYPDDVAEKYENARMQRSENSNPQRQNQKPRNLSSQREKAPTIEESEAEYKRKLTERGLDQLPPKNEKETEETSGKNVEPENVMRAVLPDEKDLDFNPQPLTSFNNDIGTGMLSSFPPYQDQMENQQNQPNPQNQQISNDRNRDNLSDVNGRTIRENFDNPTPYEKSKKEFTAEEEKLQKIKHPNILELTQMQKNRLFNEPVFEPNAYANPISPVIFPEKPKYVKRIRFVTIDSRDRDLEVYPNPNFFQVKFSPATNNTITKSCLVKGDTAIINYIFPQEVVGEQGATITEVFDNILSIKCTEAIIPLEATFVCGICPNRFYDNTADTFMSCDVTTTPPVLPVKRNSGLAIWNNKIGIETTVLDLPYLLLNIKELESYSPYAGTNTPTRNAFAKLVYEANFGFLTSYIKMITSDVHEYYLHAPTALSKLDKFTLSLQTPSGNLFDFGTDKLFVSRFEQSPNPLPECLLGEQPFATRVFIDADLSFDQTLPQCNCRPGLYSLCLKPGDLIFFYTTRPCNARFVTFQNKKGTDCFTNFELVINQEFPQDINISIFIVDEEEDVREPIDFSKFLCVGDYLVLQFRNIGDTCNFFFKVGEINLTNISIFKIDNITLTEDLIINKIGFAPRDKKGYQIDEKGNLLSKFGVRVCKVGDSMVDANFCASYDPENASSASGPFQNLLFFDIDIPFDNLPDGCLDNYMSGEIFLIKQKFQISYTFKVETLEKDYNTLESYLVGP